MPVGDAGKELVGVAFDTRFELSVIEDGLAKHPDRTFERVENVVNMHGQIAIGNSDLNDCTLDFVCRGIPECVDQPAGFTSPREARFWAEGVNHRAASGVEINRVAGQI